MVETNQTEFNTSPLARLQEQRKQLRLSSLLLLLFTISLAISTPILGSFLYSEIQTLEGNIAFTNNIINDSIRTISQVQWELHHLVELLEEGSDDYEALEAQRARIEQGILNVTDS